MTTTLSLVVVDPVGAPVVLVPVVLEMLAVVPVEVPAVASVIPVVVPAAGVVVFVVLVVVLVVVGLVGLVVVDSVVPVVLGAAVNSHASRVSP
jgi:hypothetical protein